MVFEKFADVQSEYEKNKELKKEDVRFLKNWAEKQSHLPQITEFQLILFLHSCYYSVEATKTCIETFYTVRAHCPEFFQNRNPTKNQDIFDVILFTPLPKPTVKGDQIIYIKFLDCNPDKFVLSQQIKSFDLTSMLSLHQLGTAPGHVLLADIKGMTFTHLTKINPLQVKKFFIYLQEALPFRLKAIIYINIPTFMDKLLAIVRPFIKKELMDTMQLYTDKWDGLYKLIPPEAFPADYGGQIDSVEELIKKRRQDFKSYEKFLVQGEKDVSDESKRTGKPKNAGDIFGIEGTFRKLVID